MSLSLFTWYYWVKNSHVFLGCAERLHPPLDIELETINCTAVRVKWRLPWRHVSTVTGYKVRSTVCLSHLYTSGIMMFECCKENHI